MRREAGGRARYEEIAQDIARRIVQGDIAEGTRVLGRSSLAGMYQVSPETIRRAIAVLHERSIVQSVAGSGVRVISANAAAAYLESLTARSMLEEDSRELRMLMKQHRELDEQIVAVMDRIMIQASGAIKALHVEEVTVRAGAWVVGRSLGEIRLRSWTGATAVAVSRDDVDYFSPPADMLLAPGDVVTIIGSEAARARARSVLDSAVPPAELPSIQ